jgi:hypothetical protein
LAKQRQDVRGEDDENSVIFAAGFCQGWLTSYSFAQGQSTDILTERVANLLHSDRSGRQDRMLHVSPKATGAFVGLSEVEMASHARSDGAQDHKTRRKRRRMSASARAKISKSMKARWAAGKMKGNQKKAA